MKVIKVFKMLVMGVMAALTFVGCKDSSTVRTTEELFELNPVTVKWKKSKSGEIEGFKADVEVYSMNSRKDSYLTIQNKYRLAMKKIDGVQYTRIDLEGESNGGRAKSIISNDKEMIVFDTKTNDIEFRLPINNEVSSDLAFLNIDAGFSRINLDRIVTESKRLALDVSEADEKKTLSVSIPSDYFPANKNERRLSTKISFDKENETLDEVEIVTVQEDGTVVTSTSSPFYEDYNSTPVKVGTVTVIDTKVPYKIKGFPEDYPIYESYDDIPEISDEDYERLLENSPVYAAYCINAGNWIGDIDGQLANLIGSNEGDGLVAKDSQYYSQAYHEKLLVGDSEDEKINGYVSFPEYNHANINPFENEDVKRKINKMLKDYFESDEK